MERISILRAGYLASFAQALRSQDIDPVPLLHRHQLPEAFEALPEYMVAARTVHAFVRDAVLLAPPGSISTAAGFHHARTQANPFREGGSSAITLLEAIQRHNDLVPRYGPGACFSLETDHRPARWSKLTRSPMAETEIFCVANMTGHIRSFADPSWVPTLIQVSVASPATLMNQPEFAAVPVREAENGSTVLQIPIGDLGKCRTRFKHRTTDRAGTPRSQEPDFLESLRLLMAGYVRTGSLSIERIADAAGVSARTLQRRLRNAGISYSGLADQVRSEVAITLLTAPEKSVTEIAFELGYSDPGSFSRAFRRFVHMAPVEYRRRYAENPAPSLLR